MALSCNPANERPGKVEDLRSGQLLDGHLTRLTVPCLAPKIPPRQPEMSGYTKSEKVGPGDQFGVHLPRRLPPDTDRLVQG